MHKKKTKKKTERRLKRLRRIVYTTISLAVIESSGIFSLAKTGLLYIQSNAVTNAFSPKTYVDIEVTEPNGDTYYIKTIENELHARTSDDESKEAYITNPGTSIAKKTVVVRAKIVAVICDKDGVEKGTTQSFTISGGEVTNDVTVEKSWYKKDGYYYYTSILEPGEKSASLFEDVILTDITNIPDDGYVALHVMVDTIEVDTTDTSAAKATNKEKIQENWTAIQSITGLWENDNVNIFS